MLEVASELCTVTLPLNRALWAAILVTEVGKDQAALIVVFHHVLADGAAGLTLLSALMDGAPALTPLTLPRSKPSRAQLIADARRDGVRALRDLPAALTQMAKTLSQFTPALRTRLASSSLNQPTGPRRRIATVSSDLTLLHAAAQRHGATVNDALLSAATGALRRLLAGRGERADSFVISMPVSFRQDAAGEKLGNQSAVIPVRLPATGRPGERLRAVARLTAAAKRTPPGASNALLRPVFQLLSRLGLYRHFIDHQRLIHTFVTNVREPAQPLSLGGCPVLDIVPLATAGGNITVSFAALSYAGRLTVLADPDTCPDLDDLQALLQAELEALTGSEPNSSVQLTPS
ncbi:wax ester/triacylglycerol synthase domain-containing protein [Deinococcus oregonensis]|uniref:diacylglycerol O-acyltransferase n=1 Tax=Deinococcus oregonensis TaxID=1805970 RepID=A0ABV6ASC2_9DEIO